MKIGIDISQIVHEGTGVAMYTRQLVKELLRQNGKNEYILFGASLRKKEILDDFASELKNDGLKFKTSFWLVPPTFLDEIWNQIHHVKVERLIGKIDVFHSSDWTQPPTKAKKITTIHDMVIYKYPQFSHNKTEFRTDVFAPSANIVSTHKRRNVWVKKECDLIIADSEATKKDIVENLGIPEGKIRVVYLSAGEDYTKYAKSDKIIQQKKIKAIREKYLLPEKYLLAVGTREPRKNLDSLFEAFKKLSKKNTTLVIVGKYGWGGENEKLKIKNVKLLGYIPQEDMPALYAGAQAFVYPSLYEGFGVPLLEAMTVGCPVITSNISSMPEVGGNAAIYFDPNSIDDIKQKIDEFLSLSPKAVDSLQKKSVFQAKKFSWKKTARDTLNIYETLIS